MYSVCLLGHSFIRRLDHYMQQQYYSNLRLFSNQFYVFARAQGGLTVKKLIHQRPDLYDFGYVDILYLQIGGNDLSHQSASKTATDIVSFANFLCQYAGIVIIGQLLFRHPDKVGEHYNQRVIECNRLIQDLIKDNNQIIFWHHRGFWRSLDFLHPDGTHLNAGGMRKYHRSIRQAVLHSSNILNY